MRLQEANEAREQGWKVHTTTRADEYYRIVRISGRGPATRVHLVDESGRDAHTAMLRQVSVAVREPWLLETNTLSYPDESLAAYKSRVWEAIRKYRDDDGRLCSTEAIKLVSELDLREYADYSDEDFSEEISVHYLRVSGQDLADDSDDMDQLLEAIDGLTVTLSNGKELTLNTSPRTDVEFN